MFKISKKIIFIAFVICLFCIGLGINDVIEDYRKSHNFLVKDLFIFIPYIISGGIFFYILYIKKEKDTKSHSN